MYDEEIDRVLAGKERYQMKLEDRIADLTAIIEQAKRDAIEREWHHDTVRIGLVHLEKVLKKKSVFGSCKKRKIASKLEIVQKILRHHNFASGSIFQ